MSNRRFEMYEYRQVIHRMRMGESDRTIARTRLMGRIKCGQIRDIAGERGWLDKGLPLPDDEVLVEAFEKKQQDDNPTHQSLSRSYEEQIRKWVEENVCMTTIHQTLVDQFGFVGSYSSVRRLVQRLQLHQPKATCMLDFAPGEAAQVDFGNRRLDVLCQGEFFALTGRQFLGRRPSPSAERPSYSFHLSHGPAGLRGLPLRV